MSLAEPSKLVAIRADLAWNLTAMVGNQGTTFIASIITANLLGRGAFGEFAGIQQTQFTLANVAQLASWFTASKFVAEYRISDPGRAAAILRMCHRLALTGGIFAALLLLALAPWLARAVFLAPQLTTGLMMTAATVLFATLSTFQLGALAGLGGHRSLAWAAIATSLVYLPVSALLTLRYGFEGAIIALLLRFSLQWLIQSFLLRQECVRNGLPSKATSDDGLKGLLWRFSLPAAIAGCLSWPVLWVATTCLARQPNGFHELAMFTAANTYRMLTLFLPFTVSNFAWSRLNHHRGLGDAAQSHWLFRRNLLMAGGLSLTGAVAVTAFAPVLLPLFGKSFGDGRTVLVTMMAATVPEALTIAAQQAVHSQSRIWRSLCCITLPRDLTIVAAAYCLTPQYGAVGLAVALAMGWSIALGASLFLAWYAEHEAAPSAIVHGHASRRPRRERPLPCQN